MVRREAGDESQIGLYGGCRGVRLGIESAERPDLRLIPWTRAFGPCPIRVHEAWEASPTERSTHIWEIPVGKYR